MFHRKLDGVTRPQHDTDMEVALILHAARQFANEMQATLVDKVR